MVAWLQPRSDTAVHRSSPAGRKSLLTGGSLRPLVPALAGQTATWPPRPSNTSNGKNHRKSPASRDLGRRLSGALDDARRKWRTIQVELAGSEPPAAHGADQGGHDGTSPTNRDGCGAPYDSPGQMVYGCSKNAPNYATLCHFSGPPPRPAGAAAGAASPCRVMGSVLRCGPQGPPKPLWHRCTEVCHFAGGLVFAMGSRCRTRAAPPKWQAPVAPQGGCPAGTCQTRRARG
jgi:hypothetical protein